MQMALIIIRMDDAFYNLFTFYTKACFTNQILYLHAFRQTTGCLIYLNSLKFIHFATLLATNIYCQW